MAKHSYLLTLLIATILILSSLESVSVEARGRSKTKNKHSGNIGEEQQVEELEKQLEQQMTEEQKEEIKQDEIEHQQRTYTDVELQYLEYLGKMDVDNQYNFVTNSKEQDSFYFSHDGWDYKVYAVWVQTNSDLSTPNAKTAGKVFIQAPDGKNKYMSTKSKVDFLEIDIDQEGEWKFIFSNMQGKKDVKFTFAFLTTKDQEKPMQAIQWDTVMDKDKFDDDMNKIMKDRFFNDDEETRDYLLNVLYQSQSLKTRIDYKRNDFQVQKTLRMNWETQMVKAANSQYNYLVFECLMFAVLCYAQFAYIKRVLSNKLLL